MPLHSKTIKLMTWGLRGANVCPDDVDLALSCLRIEDPQRRRDLCQHPGLHDEILANVYLHSQFAPLLAEVKRWVARLPSSETEHTVGVFCRAGRHRSVAVAWLLCQFFVSLGARARLAHLERDAGRWSHLCQGCRSCAEGTPTKQRLAREVLALYESL